MLNIFRMLILCSQAYLTYTWFEKLLPRFLVNLQLILVFLFDFDLKPLVFSSSIDQSSSQII